MKKNAGIFFLVLFFSGCAVSSYYEYEDGVISEKHDIVSYDGVKVADSSDLQKPFVAVGEIKLFVPEWYSYESAVSKLRKTAFENGGEALSDITQSKLPKKFPRFLDWLNIYTTLWTAEVIVFKEGGKDVTA